MKKRLTALLLSLALMIAFFPSNVYAQETNLLLTNTITLENETYTYNYRTENDIVVYVEIDNHIIERKDDIIYVDGEKAATISVVSESPSISTASDIGNDTITPRSGWIWRDTGDDSLYTKHGSRTVNLALEAAFALQTVATLAGIIITFLPIPYMAQQAAQITIDFVTAVVINYYLSDDLYYHETTYRHAYLGLSYAKKLDIALNLEPNLSVPVPGATYTIYGSWS